jgi:hypothetical protein
MARAGITLKELPPPDFGEGCERSFTFRMSRDGGTVELTGFYFRDERRFILGLGWGPNPLRWFRDGKLARVVKELLTEAGLARASDGTGEDQQPGSTGL